MATVSLAEGRVDTPGWRYWMLGSVDAADSRRILWVRCLIEPPSSAWVSEPLMAFRRHWSNWCGMTHSSAGSQNLQVASWR